MNAIDTNVVVYFFDQDEPSKQRKAPELLEGFVRSASPTLLLWQVAGEVLSCLRRWQAMGKVSGDDVAANIRDVLAMFPLAIPTSNVIPRSLDLASRHSLSHWDSLLVAAEKRCQERMALRLAGLGLALIGGRAMRSVDDVDIARIGKTRRMISYRMPQARSIPWPSHNSRRTKDIQ